MKGLRFQAGSKLAAEIIGRLFQFALIYAAQRILGPADYGVITYGLAVGVVLAPVTDLGMQLIITREVAHAERVAPRVSGIGLTLKLLLTIGVVAVLLPISLQRPDGTVFATFVLGIAVIGSSFAEYFGYVFRGLRRVELDAVLTLLLRMGVFTFGFGALLLRPGINGIAVAYLIGNGIAAGVGYIWLRRRFFKPVLTTRRSASSALLRQALPLGGAILFSIAYTRTSVFLLDALNNSTAVGEYGVALRLTEPLALIPSAIMAAVFPALTHTMAQTGYASTRALRFKTIGLLALAGLSIAVGGVLLGPWLIHFLYGTQYAGSALPLQLLALASLPIFINYALTHFLVARRQQRLNFIFNIVIFVVNLGLCLWLIPRFGPGGAALATVLSEVTLLTLCSIALAR
ncbi:MAG TPA: flippase [Anaerolineae bacterium]|nr:flippase [Anaerolineae bacterium]